jgi:hypothetical protein
MSIQTADTDKAVEWEIVSRINNNWEYCVTYKSLISRIYC